MRRPSPLLGVLLVLSLGFVLRVDAGPPLYGRPEGPAPRETLATPVPTPPPVSYKEKMAVRLMLADSTIVSGTILRTEFIHRDTYRRHYEAWRDTVPERDRLPVLDEMTRVRTTEGDLVLGMFLGFSAGGIYVTPGGAGARLVDFRNVGSVQRVGQDPIPREQLLHWRDARALPSVDAIVVASKTDTTTVAVDDVQQVLWIKGGGPHTALYLWLAAIGAIVVFRASTEGCDLIELDFMEG